MDDNERVTYFGETDARNKRVRFGIKKKDRSRHMYVIGKTGMGKSTLLENLAIQDIVNGEGLAFIDPHGKSADFLMEYIPEHRIKDVIYFAPFDLDYPIAFNVLEDVGAERRHLVANGLMTAFKKIWVDAFSARMEYILSNIMLGLLEYPGSTLMGVNRMLVDKEFRNTIVNNISDPSVKSFWVDEYAKYTDKFAAEAAPAIQNKVGQFVANPLVRNIIGQEKSSFDIRKIMDEKKIFIINLSKGRVGEANANLIGAMIITKIYLAAMSRADMNESELKKAPEFYLYVDEFQSFANESFADILSEARKYKLALIIAHQYIEQMTEEVRAAVFGNVGTMAIYRVGAYDAAVFEKEFVPQFTSEDIVNLQQYQLYLKLMIDGVTSPPFSAMGMTPIPRPPITYVKEIIESSRAQFAHPREEVEDEIKRWHLEKIPPGPNAYSPAPAGGHGGPMGRDGGQGGSGVHAGGPGGYGGPQGDRGFSNDRPPKFDRFDDRPQDRSQGRDGMRDGPGAPRQSDRPRFDDRPQGPSQGSGMGGMQGGRDRGFGDRPDRGDRPQGDRFQGDRPQNDRPQGDRPPRREYQEDRVEDRRQPREDFRSGQRPIPASSNDPQKRDHEKQRETSLREAISLNYLKDKKEEEAVAKNNEKSAKPQNILALKEALLGLLNDDTQTQKPAPTPAETPASAQTPTPTQAPAPARTPMSEYVPAQAAVEMPIPPQIQPQTQTQAPAPVAAPIPAPERQPVQRQAPIAPTAPIAHAAEPSMPTMSMPTPQSVPHVSEPEYAKTQTIESHSKEGVRTNVITTNTNTGTVAHANASVGNHAGANTHARNHNERHTNGHANDRGERNDRNQRPPQQAERAEHHPHSHHNHGQGNPRRMDSRIDEAEAGGMGNSNTNRNTHRQPEPLIKEEGEVDYATLSSLLGK